MGIKGRKVLVPVTDVGIGTGTAAVFDGRADRRVRIRCAEVTLAGGVVCVSAVSHGVEGGLHRVTLPGGEIAWVRVWGPESDRAA